MDVSGACREASGSGDPAPSGDGARSGLIEGSAAGDAHKDHADAVRQAKSDAVRQVLEDSRLSYEQQDALRKSLEHKKKERAAAAAKRKTTFDVQLDRYEAKYVIPPELVPQIREYIRPFCEPDPYGVGTPPEYVLTTLQLDSRDLALHKAREHESLNRFKLRVRTYGDPVGGSPVFMEVKRKMRHTIVKSRACVPFDKWSESLIWDKKLTLRFKNRKEEDGFLVFVRLCREIGAMPICLIRYTRESYFGKMEKYARITFDRKLLYQFTNSWTDWGRSGKWRSIDTPIIQNKNLPYSGVVLEIKTLSDVPDWMLNLISDFGLVRTGHCKYSNGIWAESLFMGGPDTPIYEQSLMRFM
jgi:hypothetical protein